MKTVTSQLLLVEKLMKDKFIWNKRHEWHLFALCGTSFFPNVTCEPPVISGRLQLNSLRLAWRSY